MYAPLWRMIETCFSLCNLLFQAGRGDWRYRDEWRGEEGQVKLWTGDRHIVKVVSKPTVRSLRKCQQFI